MNEIIPFDDVSKMAAVMGKNKMFGKTPDELLCLMLIAQAEGKHPAIAAQEYDIIQGKPAINAKSAQARFQIAGGKIEWIERNDQKVQARFSHPAGGELIIEWNIARANQAGLSTKEMWKKYPAQMMSARCIAEGVRAVFPACLSGMYLSEEVQDFDLPASHEPRTVTPKALPAETAPAPEENPAKEAADQKIKEINAIGLKIARICGAPNDPRGWTEAERVITDIRALLLLARESLDCVPAEVALLRAEIADRYRGDASWPQLIADLLECGMDKSKLEEIKGKLAGL